MAAPLQSQTSRARVSPVRSIARKLLCVTLVTTALAPAAVAAGEEVAVQIFAVLASKDRQEFDPRLAPIRQELRGLPFKGYTLLGIQSCRFETGDHCAMDIPGGGYMHLTTTQSTGRQMQMRLLLNQRNRPILNAAITLNRNAGILVKGTRTDIGTMILCIKAADATPGPPAGATARKAPR